MFEKLEKRLKELGRVAVAFSGGIDSSFLLFSANKVLGKENVLAIIGNDIVCDGKNVDDTQGYRPGQKATKELGIVSPLEECGFAKKDIRENAKNLGITFWNKPSNSCLATRFPYNTELTNESLKRVELAEELIKDLDIPTTRVRSHGDIARIEVQKEYFDRILGNDRLVNDIKKLGFEYVTLDLEGMKSGRFDKK